MHSNLAHGDACWVLLSFMQWWSCTDQQNQPRNGTKASTEQILLSADWMELSGADTEKNPKHNTSGTVESNRLFQLWSLSMNYGYLKE